MNIIGRAQGVSPAYVSQKAENVKKFKDFNAVRADSKDEIIISQEGRDYRSVMKALMNVPDIRSEVTGSFDLENYKTDATRTAEKFIKEIRFFWGSDA